jgi:hypothetical protein
MAEVFAPFPVTGTMCQLTFYVMEGRNFVRKKSSLTRRKVLYAPQFKNTRHYAGLMAKASGIGSRVYQALPAHWRQFWMYQAFTGEALKMLKASKEEEEIQAFLYQRYVKEVADKQAQATNIPVINIPPKRAYQKHNDPYWKNKTIKASRRKANKERILRYAGLLGRASKLASIIYQRLPLRQHRRCYYRQLVALSMELLKDELCEEDILSELRPMFKEDIQAKREGSSNQLPGIIYHPEGYRYFMATLYKRVTTNAEHIFKTNPVQASYNLTLTPPFTTNPSNGA